MMSSAVDLTLESVPMWVQHRWKFHTGVFDLAMESP